MVANKDFFSPVSGVGCPVSHTVSKTVMKPFSLKFLPGQGGNQGGESWF